MDLKRRAGMIGFGGTIACYALVVAAFFTGDRMHHSGAGIIFGSMLLVPLLPGMMPGAFVGLVLSVPGFESGFHSTGFFVCMVLSTFVMNSALAYLWLKRK